MSVGSELWTEKFHPKEWSEFVGNSEVVARVQVWAKKWNDGKKQKPLLVYGSPGNGKTTLALLVAKTFQWSVFELNASDFRTKESIERLAGAASQGASFSGKLRLILLDEVDGLQAADRGGASAISQILKESQNPVILTANDIYEDQKLAPIRAQCELLQLKKINYLSIAKRLREICEMEGIKFDSEAIELLAKNSSGDFRSALLDLQTLAFKGIISIKDVESLGGREREENIFSTVRALFKAKTLEESRKARFKSEVDEELLARWIEENIPIEFDFKDTASAFDFFSRGDIFEGRIFKRQDYGMRRYSLDLMIACAPLSREKEYSGWTQYQFPQLLRKLSASRSARETRLSICKKVGKQINASARSVMQYELPLLFEFFHDKQKAAALTAQFNFEEKEVAFLMQSKPETKKVQLVLEEAEKLREKALREKFGKVVQSKELVVEKPLIEKNAEKNKKKKAEKRKPEAEEHAKQTTLFGKPKKEKPQTN
ncbi:MAG: replication factor C large subunit [Candidatus Diapherotrites archaeon]